MQSIISADKNSLDRARELLKLQGYDVSEPQESWMWVTVEKFGYMVSYNKIDSDFYRVAFPLSLRKKDKRAAEYLAAANKTNAQSKLAKAFLDDEGDLNIVVDLVAPGPKEFAADFVRAISAIQTALSLFDDEVDL